MKALTQSERGEIVRVIDAAKEAEKAALDATDVNWRDRVELRKRKVAVGTLKIAKEVTELDKLDTQIRALQVKRDDVELRIRKKMPLNERSHRGSCPDHKDMCEAIDDICSQVNNRETAKDATGKKFLAIQKKYRKMRENLAASGTRQDAVALGVFMFDRSARPF